MRSLLPFVLLCAAAIAHAQQYAVVEMHASGSQKFSEQDILRASGLEKSKRAIPLAEVKIAAGKLLGMGAFSEVSFKHSALTGGMKVEFVVKDAGDFVPAQFDNIVWLPRNELLAELHARVPLFNGQLPLNGSLAEDVSAALKSLLESRGIANLVSFAPSGPREGVIDSIVYTVEDADIKIGQINFSGVSTSFSAQLEDAAKSLLGTHYQRSTLKKFIEHNLTNVYRRRGYLKAAFLEPVVSVASRNGAQTAVAISLPVQEGRAYALSGVQWSGNTAKATTEFERFIHLRQGEPVDGVQLDFDLTQIRTRYAQAGYMHMVLDPVPVFDETAATVRYQIVVNEGELFSMGKLEISGLQPTSEERVRQRWRLREGEPFDSGYVNRFFDQFRLPAGVAYVVEQSEGEHPNSIDLTLIFCKASEKCMASAPNQLYIPEEEPRKR